MAGVLGWAAQVLGQFDGGFLFLGQVLSGREGADSWIRGPSADHRDNGGILVVHSSRAIARSSAARAVRISARSWSAPASAGWWR